MREKTFVIKLGSAYVTKKRPYTVTERDRKIVATNIVVEDGIEALGECCFAFNDNIKNVSLPDSITSIEDDAFNGCSELLSINIPKNVKIINVHTFGSCYKLESISIPDNVEVIDERAFESCTSLTSIVLPKSIREIRSCAFWGCENLSSITIPNGVEEIGDDAFWGCRSLLSICIPKSVTRIGRCVFSSSGIREPVVHNKSLVYAGCDVGEIFVVPNGVERICEEAFYHCMSMRKVIIPSSVNVIEKNAFYNCWNLDVADIANKDIEIMPYAFPKHVEFEGAYQETKIKANKQVCSKNDFIKCKKETPLKHCCFRCLTQEDRERELEYYKQSEYKDGLVLANMEYLLKFGCPKHDVYNVIHPTNYSFLFDGKGVCKYKNMFNNFFLLKFGCPNVHKNIHPTHYCFLFDGLVVSEVKKALKENRPMTVEDWLNRFYDDVKQEYVGDSYFSAKTIEEYIKGLGEAVLGFDSIFDTWI